jgi:hypothetical protein
MARLRALPMQSHIETAPTQTHNYRERAAIVQRPTPIQQRTYSECTGSGPCPNPGQVYNPGMATLFMSRHTQLGKPRRNYVYAWYDEGTLFYIGRGVGGRGLLPCHNRAAERKRHCSLDFTCVVLCDDMGRDYASKLESWCIKQCAPAYNTRLNPRMGHHTVY